MKVPIRLQELLQQSTEAMQPFLMLIGQGNAAIDGSGVDQLEHEQIDQLFSYAPDTWDIADLWAIFNVDTLSDTLASQLESWIDQRRRKVSDEALVLEHPEQPDPQSTLDIFNLRDEVIKDYREYINSFLKIRDHRIRTFVDQELEKGELWPDPLVQLNPSYKEGSSIIHLIAEGLLHPDCERYFPDYISKYKFRLHQEQAFRVAQRYAPYVLTTGTGSGKSMTYVVPIFDDLLRNPNIQGVRAILVYPMNALINSQKEEFDKYLENVLGTHIRVEQYTGQESLAKKTEIQSNPPQIILTNGIVAWLR